MQLAEISVRRPVFATVLSLLLVLVGLVAYGKLPLREYPKIDEPVVTVETRYAGASSDVIESQVTKPLEDSIAGIDGVDILSSISRQEQSQITVRFRLERDADSAAADVRDRVARVRGKLPTSADEPVIAKVEADAQPIIWLSLTSDSLSAMDLTDLASRTIKPKLQTFPGAADVRIFGERKYAMRVWLDAQRLAAYKLTTQDVEDAIRKQNLEVPAGRIESDQREFNVTAQTDLTTPKQFNEIIVKQSNGFAVKLRDVARVEIAPASERTGTRFNGKPAVSMGIIRQATANPLELSKAVEKNLPRMQADLPAGVEMTVANDTTVFISRSIEAVYKTILEAVILVALVIFVFLRTLRASIIPLVTIPVSLIGAFALIAIAGFTVNTLTLLALVLAIGLVVDDAIVVLENIYRHIEEGMPPFKAAIVGSKEIGFAVVAMTLTLAAVFAPLAFTPGRTGKLFVEFALTLAGAVVVSGFVALTLSPMMSSVLLKRNDKPNWFDRGMERVLNGLTAVYTGVLKWTLLHRWLVVGVMLLSAVATYWLFTTMKRELAPMEDRGTIITVVNGPEGSSYGYTDKYVRAADKFSDNVKEIDRRFLITGGQSVQSGTAIFRTVDWNERTRTTPEIARELQGKLSALPGVTAFAITPPSLGQGFRDRPVSFVISTGESYPQLAQVTQAFMAELAKNPGFVQPDTDLRLNKPEIFLAIDRERAADLGVSVDAAAKAVETMLGGRNVTRFKRDGEQYDVILQTTPSARNTPDDIDAIYVRTRSDQLVPLSSIVKVTESVAPRELNHFGQRRAVVVSSNLAPNFSLGEALQYMDDAAKRVLKPGYTTDVTQQSREFKTSSSSIAVIMVLALLFIYLVMAAQFESFIDPFVIMLSVPLSMVGALAALQLSGGTLNVYSQIGLITLVGLITKHGILIVEFANQLREKGRPMHEAIVESASQRLRPILMTTGAMVLGAVPLALSRGAGAESRTQIGWVIVGGMSLGTLLTIFVVPTMYSLFARSKVPGAIHEPDAKLAVEMVPSK
jgi:multidrug efflux pump